MSTEFRPKKLRACIDCRRVQYEKEFSSAGCANCGTRHCTANFHGLLAMITPKDSWVARWQHSTHLKPGMYAVSVIVPDGINDDDDLLEGEQAVEGLHYGAGGHGAGEYDPALLGAADAGAIYDD